MDGSNSLFRDDLLEPVEDADGMQHQQQAELRVVTKVGHGRRGELSGPHSGGVEFCGDALLVGQFGLTVGVGAAIEGKPGEGTGGDDSCGKHCDHGSESRQRSVLECRFAYSSCCLQPAAFIGGTTAGVEESSLVGGECHIGAPGPFVEHAEPGSGQQVVGIAIRFAPCHCFGYELPMSTQVISCLVYPPLQPRPLPEEGLVGNLDRWFSGGGIPIEGQEAMSVERVQDGVHRRSVDRQRIDLGQTDAPSGVLGAFTERDQSQEELPRRAALVSLQPPEERLGTLRQRSLETTHRDVVVHRQLARLTAVEHLGEGVLEQGK